MVYRAGKASLLVVLWLLSCGTGQTHAADALEKAADFFGKAKEAATDSFEEGRRISENILNKGGEAVDAAKDAVDKAGARGRELLNKGPEAATGKTQAQPEKISYGSGPGYSRLIIRNQCYRVIKAEIEEFRNSRGYDPRWIKARSVQYFELWRGTKTVSRTYAFTRDGAPELRKTLESITMEAETSTASLRDILLHEYTYTFCKDEPALGTQDAEFARPAEHGEQIDVFETYLTQVPESRKKEHAYRKYPVLVFLNDYPLFYTRSDDEGVVRISLPKGTQGRLRIYGTAFQSDTGLLLYDEWAPSESFTAKGGETVYRIPPHKNITGW